MGRDATQDQIKQAYRKAARKCHPDVSKDALAEAKFKDIGEAYETDPGGFSDFFESLSGMARPDHAPSLANGWTKSQQFSHCQTSGEFI